MLGRNKLNYSNSTITNQRLKNNDNVSSSSKGYNNNKS